MTFFWKISAKCTKFEVSSLGLELQVSSLGVLMTSRSHSCLEILTRSRSRRLRSRLHHWWESYYSLSICLNLFRGIACFAYGKTVINQCRVEKSPFEGQSEENSVWILKWTTLLGIFCKIGFTPAVTFCYQVHTPKTDTHIPTAHWNATLGATGAESSLKLTA